MSEFEPSIVVFACNWVPGIAADNAGVNGAQYGPEVKVIRIVCSGRMSPALILRTFAEGADGVFVAGCQHGECHFHTGNSHCEKVVEETKALLSAMGVDPARLRLNLFGEVEGEGFAAAMNAFSDGIRSLGSIAVGTSS